jgi:hypothetical protein
LTSELKGLCLDVELLGGKPRPVFGVEAEIEIIDTPVERINAAEELLDESIPEPMTEKETPVYADAVGDSEE